MSPRGILLIFILPNARGRIMENGVSECAHFRHHLKNGRDLYKGSGTMCIPVPRRRQSGPNGRFLSPPEPGRNRRQIVSARGDCPALKLQHFLPIAWYIIRGPILKIAWRCGPWSQDGTFAGPVPLASRFYTETRQHKADLAYKTAQQNGLILRGNATRTRLTRWNWTSFLPLRPEKTIVSPPSGQG